MLDPNDRDALARRNADLAAQKHARTPKETMRAAMLAMLARQPVRKQAGRTGRALLIRPDHLGDLLLTVPAIYLLKQARPELALHALVGPWSKAAFERIDALDNVDTLDFPGFTRQPPIGTMAAYRLAKQAAEQLRQIGYDHAVILRPDHWWGAMLARLAGIPNIIGFDTTDVRPFLTKALPYHPYDHSVRQNLDLAGALAGQRFVDSLAYLHYPLNDADYAASGALLAPHGYTSIRPLVCIHPGSGTLTKQWEPSRWSQVAAQLAERWGSFTVFTGSASEVDLCRAAASGLRAPHVVLAGQTPLPLLAALYARARVVLGPDSGPLHLAAAVQSSTVALFGPARVSRFGTWGPRARHATLTSSITCLGCGVLNWPEDPPEFHPCVRDITVERVVGAAVRVSAAS